MINLEPLKEELNIYNKNLRKKDLIISYIRLFVFLVFVGLFILGFTNSIFFYLLIIPFIIYVGLCFLHISIKSKYTKKLETINEYEKRINKDIKNLPKSLESKDYLAVDLGIFNENSLFQYINIAKTDNGKKILSNYLLNGNENKLRANKLVDKMNDFNFHLELNEVLKKNDVKTIIAEKDNIKIDNRLFILNIIINIIGIILIILSFMIKPHYGIMALLVNYMVVKIISNKYNFKSIKRKISVYNKYNEIIRFFKSYNIEDDYYKELTDFNSEYLNKIKKLEILTSFTSNELFSIVLNGLFSIDSIIILLYFKNKINEFNLLDISNKIGTLEALASLSVIPLTNDITCIPNFNDKLDIKGLYHPLIKKPVLNDFKMKSNQVLITGSNMSGKTTFMRSIAINIVLANAGGMCLAEKFDLKDYKIKTSMIINDDLYNGISTFEMELKKLKCIIDSINDSDNFIIFIDELFRGTNQIDRIKGAKYLIKYLNKKNIDLFMSTHDLELFNLDIDVYHFEEEYEENNIHFDYLLKSGPSTKTNAIRLMKMIGLDIDE